jgi:hypothetical protein
MNLKRIALPTALVLLLITSVASAQEAPSKKNGDVMPVPAAVPKVVKERPTRQQLIDTFGTAQISYYRIPSSEFTPMSTALDTPYRDYWYDQGSNIFRRYSQVPLGYYVASPHLPSGATVAYFELDGCSTNATNTVTGSLYDCDFTGDCSSNVPTTVSLNVNGGCSFATGSPNYTVDNYLKTQVVRVVTQAGDNTTNFSGVIIGYYLNVSPAPGSATFNDVPTGHPFFKYIEALSASGVTGGCQASPPLYCPDNPLTRGQMAVFLAKALGLQFN